MVNTLEQSINERFTMIERISELPFFGPEEQLRKFICQHDQPNGVGKFDPSNPEKEHSGDGKLYKHDINTVTELHQNGIIQDRIANIDDILQKQLIWSYDFPQAGDAYFYWDWCPTGDNGEFNIQQWEWDLNKWYIYSGLQNRSINRTFNYRDFEGYTNNNTGDQMVISYSSKDDSHTNEESNIKVNLEVNDCLHNMMRSYIEVSEWMGDGAEIYGSRNGFVSRKMSMCWLFDAIRALINFKMRNQDKYAEKDIHPLDGTYDKDKNPTGHMERFLKNGEKSEQGVEDGSDPLKNYTDSYDLDCESGRCSVQVKVRAANPMVNGILKVRGNEWHYGERADFYTHNSFMGECRFFHNTRFLGQATFDKEINGTAMRSRWADLAEYKESDKDYEPGTLVMFGGAKEITLSNGVKTHAIVTTNPGFVLNGDKQEGKTMVGIALVGTVPVKVVGVVRKFDKLVPSKKVLGAARARKWYEFWKNPIGIAMNGNHDGMVDCVTRLTF